MRLTRKRGLAVAVLVAVVAGGMLPLACGDEGGTASASTSSGAGGGDGGCYAGPPLPLFVLTLRAYQGALPDDLTLAVKWSAGEEPLFSLADPSSWKTLEQGANVVCDLDADAGASPQLDELRCELWTSGPTEITVTSAALDPYADTLAPLEQPGCDAPMSSEVEVVLGEPPDGGS